MSAAEWRTFALSPVPQRWDSKLSFFAIFCVVIVVVVLGKGGERGK